MKTMINDISDKECGQLVNDDTCPCSAPFREGVPVMDVAWGDPCYRCGGAGQLMSGKASEEMPPGQWPTYGTPEDSWGDGLTVGQGVHPLTVGGEGVVQPLTVGQAAQLDHCGLYRYSPKAEQERLAVENFAVNEPESTADRDEAIASSSDLSIRIAVQVYSSLLGAYLAEGNRRGLFA